MMTVQSNGGSNAFFFCVLGLRTLLSSVGRNKQYNIPGRQTGRQTGRKRGLDKRFASTILQEVVCSVKYAIREMGCGLFCVVSLWVALLMAFDAERSLHLTHLGRFGPVSSYLAFPLLCLPGCLAAFSVLLPYCTVFFAVALHNSHASLAWPCRVGTSNQARVHSYLLAQCNQLRLLNPVCIVAHRTPYFECRLEATEFVEAMAVSFRIRISCALHVVWARTIPLARPNCLPRPEFNYSPTLVVVGVWLCLSCDLSLFCVGAGDHSVRIRPIAPTLRVMVSLRFKLEVIKTEGTQPAQIRTFPVVGLERSLTRLPYTPPYCGKESPHSRYTALHPLLPCLLCGLWLFPLMTLTLT